MREPVSRRIVIVGGGIVGVCNALALQRAGHQVTLVDRATPGRETSYGNAGVLSESSIGVLNNPGLLK
ncbi:MAG: FAD-dependent oxidoreductase, partial [Alphaproteobacteria bacterium]